ncbi:hypothetical protein ABVK25_005908 [Lepraria finkii]|uniref:Uncharacterized protein n=1 Tax=Lepraria finkii TaxID=1340010 RepID=A0ABR4B816_9LECA
MAPKASDAWLWVGLAALGYYTAMVIHRQLVAIRRASEITHYDKPPDILSQRTENALKLNTLGRLAQSANQDIRAASIKIITERLFQGGEMRSTWKSMMGDLTGSNAERRDKTLTCLRFVAKSSQSNEAARALFHLSFTYRALITCLCGLLPEARGAESSSSYRSQPERDSLWLLDYILPFHTTQALQADVIGRWLTHYPFGGEGVSLSEKKKIMRDIARGDYFYEDSDFGCSMESILRRFFTIEEFRKQMERHNLVDAMEGIDEDLGISRPSIGRTGRGSQGDWEHISVGTRWTTGAGDYLVDPEQGLNWSDINLDETARTRAGNDVGPSERGREQSPEEQALRRRRREAMVLGENGRPIQRGDIIQRGPIVLDEEVEEELEQLMEEITEVEAEAVNDRSWWGWISRIRPDGLAPRYP